MSLPNLMVQHYHDFNLKKSIKKVYSVWIFLWECYEVEFNKDVIEQLLPRA